MPPPNEAVGLLKRASIVSVSKDGTLQVKLANASAIGGSGQSSLIQVQAPHSLFYNNGLFMGTLPVEGTPVVIGQGSGGQFHFVSFLAEDPTLVPDLKPGVLLLRSNNDTQITLGLNNQISIGSPVNNIHIHTDLNYVSTNFQSEYSFTQATRRITGAIKRDTEPNLQFSQENKLDADIYDDFFKPIGLDPKVPVNTDTIGVNKNPALVENRELIYEFQYQSDIADDQTESLKYGKSNSNQTTYTNPNRRISRADTLSLSLVAPNYLMETVKGTVVDIYGNILDLNRSVLPVGQEPATLKTKKSSDKGKTFLLIKELERKSLAYHFEINARKDLPPDIKSNEDYGRNRSRFFLDIDKEGQFKLNVPASSKTGNIPLLTRYENYSTFNTDDPNPNKLVFPTDRIDIYQDSFASIEGAGTLPTPTTARGTIKIVGEDGNQALSKDRITDSHLNHGTAYHDILNTCFMMQKKDYFPPTSYMRDEITVNLETLKNVVSDTITVSGSKANAGGRSGSINFDGMIEMNIGANTIDRQSWWLDTAGGIVANIGRDLNGRSLITSLDGDFLLQVGGFAVQGDSRFTNPKDGINNKLKGAILDLRIFTDGGRCHMIRCDNQGITILSPGNIAIHSLGVLELTSDTSIKMEAPQITLQGRTVMNAPMGSI